MDEKGLTTAPFELMERADEEIVINEIKGRVIDEFVYEIPGQKDPKTGESVTGLSLVGVRETVREMNKRAMVRIAISDREPKVVETDDYFEVWVYAIDTLNGGGYWGIKRQAKTYENGRRNPFALEQALAKAQRNAQFGLIPAHFVKEMIQEWRRQQGRVRVIEEKPRRIEPKPQSSQAEPTKSVVTTSRPYTPDQVRAALKARVDRFSRAITDETLGKMRGLLAGTLNAMVGDDERRHWLLSALCPESKGSASNLSAAWTSALLDWVKVEKNSEGLYVPTPDTEMAKREAEAILTQWQKEQGQKELGV